MEIIYHSPIYDNMDRFVHNKDFNKDMIFEKISDITTQLEEEQSKDEEERDFEKEKKLIYAQWIQGLKLSTLSTGRNFYF